MFQASITLNGARVAFTGDTEDAAIAAARAAFDATGRKAPDHWAFARVTGLKVTAAAEGAANRAAAERAAYDEFAAHWRRTCGIEHARVHDDDERGRRCPTFDEWKAGR